MKEILSKLKKLIVSPSLFSIWRWSKGHRGGILWISFLQVAMAVLGLAFTLATKGLIDAAVSSSNSGIRFYIVVLVSVILLQLVAGFVLKLDSLKITARLRQQMRSMVIREVFEKQYSEVAAMNSGELTSKILTDTNTVTSAIIQIVPSLLCLGTQFLGASIILFRLNPLFIFSLIGIGIIGALCMIVFGKKIKKYHKNAREKEDRVLSVIQEMMQNLRIIKASEIEVQMKDKIWSRQKEYVASEIERGKFSMGANTVINMIFRFGWLYTMLWGCFGIFHGTITYGTLTAMLQLVGQVQGPIANLSQLVGQLYGAVSSAERLDEVIALAKETEYEDEESIGSDRASYAHLKEIRISDLHFSYGREEVLKHVSFSIAPGDITAITGHSGCGKSTFFLLLMGLYPSDQGEIEFCFAQEAQEDAASQALILHPGRHTRKMFSYVPQGNALFSGTIRDNITMFRPEATEEEVLQAMRFACIDTFVDSLEKGMDTLLGEKGMGLSEGQGQRIALARAFLSHAPILLLDEATSALDEETEAKVLMNIAGLPDKTCLIVTHRPAALQICNKRLSMEKQQDA